MESCLRASSPGAGPTARVGAVAFIHRLPFALERLRELHPEHLPYERTKLGPGRPGSLLLKSMQLLYRLAALVPLPRNYRQRNSGGPARVAAHRDFPRRPGTPAPGRSATVESERERFDRRRSQYDPNRA